MTLHVSAAPDASTAVAIIQREVRALDPSLPVFQLQTMRARVDDWQRQERLVAAVATGLSIAGSLLAAGYFPARRALRMDPITALRND